MKNVYSLVCRFYHHFAFILKPWFLLLVKILKHVEFVERIMSTGKTKVKQWQTEILTNVC